MPWRPGDTYRERNHTYVTAHLRAMLPEAIHMDVDTGHERFHRAAARNAAVERAGSGVVVLCDADTLPEEQPLRAAIESAALDGHLHLPYTLFVGLSQEGADQVHQGVSHRSAHVLETSSRPTGGVLVIDADAYWEAGGHDERFTGWGWEDTAFRRQADCLLGPTVTHPGIIYHLWHPSAANLHSAQYHTNQNLYRNYHRYRNDPTWMRSLTREWRSV
ncbi:galactosyltransferase-related protein [Streptomyces sp. NPDC057554]|uniref:galactosyltransferase-related protein n=1 Tax=Streptomyces sp. NPDC057554 TaxID=3350538 RepID=UPI0036CAA5CB